MDLSSSRSSLSSSSPFSISFSSTSSSSPVKPSFPISTKFPTQFERIQYKTYNWLDNRLWPIRPLPFAASVALAAGICYKSRILSAIPTPNFSWRGAKVVKIGIVAFLSAYLPVFALRQFLKHFYFSYKGFLFENPKKPPSLATKLWNGLRYLLSFSPPILESCDSLLPNLPVPKLESSVDGYLKSMKYILSDEEMKQVSEQAASFLANEGKKLNRYVWLYSLFVDNYVTPFWEKYAYLYGRYPLTINSSVAHCDVIKQVEATRAHRAARFIWIETMAHLAVDRQDLKPVSGGLVCTRHYKKSYTVTRIPGETIDELKSHAVQKHVVIILRGKFYRIQVCDDRNNIFSVEQLTKVLHEVISRNESEDGAIGKIAALTHDRRDAWAKNRKKYFLDHPENAKSLRVIESAIAVFVLDESDDYGYDEQRPEVFTNFLKNMLTGDGANRWVDKSSNYVCSKNARCGGNTEHSIADGAEFDHVLENYLYMDLKFMPYKSVQEQEEMAQIASDEERQSLKLAEPLKFEIADVTMVSEISRCYEAHQKAKNDVDLYALAFRKFGKGRIKKCGVSPDAFVQMAIQLAVYRDLGKFELTYEPASVRFFANSRTETLRTVNDHSCEFVLAMVDQNEKKQQRAKLLKRACETHALKNKNCMVGNGIDRHLFALYVFSKATGNSSPFLETYMSQKWTISTSHVPNMTNQIDEDADSDFTWLGACFGAVCADGYGVCYRFGGNHSIFANVTSYHSSEKTDSARFAKHLSDAFQELSELFD